MTAATGLDDTLRRLVERVDRADTDQVRAARIIELAAERGTPAVRDGMLTAWLELWRHDLHTSFDARGIRGRFELNQLAHAALRLDGRLHGPDVHLRPGLLVAAGDELVVTRASRGHGLEPGVLLQVLDIHDHGCMVVDAPTMSAEPIAIPAGGHAARTIAYSYARDHTLEHEREHSRDLGHGLAW